jgi:peptidoglycan hydrolase-like protein with peptidoglycan-binding domain
LAEVDDKPDVGGREPLGVLPAGTRLGNYTLASVLGQGGFGITYLARDAQLNREVAIKEYLPVALALRHNGTTVMPRSTEQASDFVWGRERFLDEARTLAQLEGAPAVVRVIDFLEANGTAYTVMALARGDTLERRIREHGPLGAEAVERLLYPLIDGLEQVHEAGFLHRDIKPANIIVDPRGNPTLIDFGASRAAMAGRTAAMTAIFTPGYAAAEQFTSARQGPWTDVYGLSATLYHAITGTVPPSAFDRMLDDAYAPLSRLQPAGFASGLLAGIDAGLAVRASHRPQSIADWRPVLRGTVAPLSAGEATIVVPKAGEAPAPAVQPSAAPAAAAKTTNRRQLVWGAVAALAIVLAAGAWFGRSMFQGAAVQSMTAEELSKALEERRKTDAIAAEKKKLEEEAARQAEADAEAKKKADADLAAAQAQRQKAEEELAKLKADLEARKKAAEEARQKAAAEAQRLLDEAKQKQAAEAEMAALRKADEEAKAKAAADAAAQQAALEEAQKKAEAEAAATRAAEEAAQKKAAAEAQAKRQADEALAQAQAERKKADELAAKQQAELDAKQKSEAAAKALAEAEAKAKAEAEAKKKAEEEAKKKAEAAEAGLKLAALDRQHLQVALTAKGFDTRGSDGAFGPRSREMIVAWQRAHNLPETGFLDAGQQQALLKEGAAAIDKYDADQKKIEDDKKKAEEEAKKKADDEAKKKAAEEEARKKAEQAAPGVFSSQGNQPQTDAERQREKEKTDQALNGLMKEVPKQAGTYDGTYSATFPSSGGPRTITLSFRNGTGSGTVVNQACGAAPVTATISDDGKISGGGSVFDAQCQRVPMSMSGNATGSTLNVRLSTAGGANTASLSRGAAPAAAVAPAPTTTPAGPSSFDGAYSGGFNVSGVGMGAQSLVVTLKLQVANAHGTGTSNMSGGQAATMPPGSFSIDIAPSGDVSGQGEMTGMDWKVAKFTIKGRAEGGRLKLDLIGLGRPTSVTLGKAQ